MAKVDIDLLKKLRQDSQAGIADCRRALEETENDYKKALEWLRAHGVEKAQKKSERETRQGLVETYIHGNGRIGAMVELLCETDFVARTDEFKNLAHEIAMQVSAMEPKNVPTLLKQEYIRDNSMTVEDLIKQEVAKLGENITVGRFERFEIGKT